MIHENLSEFLNDLGSQSNNEFLAEYQISSNINRILKNLNDYEPTSEEMYEQIAFEFIENYSNKETGWGCYYGQYPSIQKITLETLNYWRQRSQEVKNPVLSARYADLVIDFYKKITGRNPENIIDLILTVINSNLEICDKLLLDQIHCKTKIKRCLDLALSFKDNKKIDLTNIINKIIVLEEKIGEDGLPGLWGFAFDWLILEKNNTLVLDKAIKIKIIENLELRLQRISVDPHLTQHAVGLLAEFYASIKDEINLTRVLKTLEDSYKLDKRLSSEPILQNNSYDKIREIYKLYQDKGFSVFKHDVDRITKEINNLDLDWSNSMQKIETKLEIPTKDIENFLNSLFNTEGVAEEEKLKLVIMKLAINFMPKKEELEKQFNDIVAKHSLLFMFPTQIISDEGFISGTILGIDNEKSKKHHFVKNSSQDLSVRSFFLEMAIIRFKKHFTAQELVNIIRSTVLFEKENIEYLNRAIRAFWENDFIVSSHLFIPIIETGIRKLVKLNGGHYLSFISKNGGYQVKSLSVLLEEYDKIIDYVFAIVDNEASFYFKLVLTENFGFNLRNDFAHGINKEQFFNYKASNMLFHIILLLCQVVLNNKEKNIPPS